MRQGLATEITHPEYHCHPSDSEQWPSYDDEATQPRWYLGRPSRELAAFFADQTGWAGTAGGDDVNVIAPAGRIAVDLGCGDGRDTRFLRDLGFRASACLTGNESEL